MSYDNKYSNKPFEIASKSSHSSIINDRDVKSFLEQCIIPSLKEVEEADIKKNFLEDLKDNPIKIIIAVDGGFTNVTVKEDHPSSSIAFFQFGALLLWYDDLKNIEEKPFADPDDFSKLTNIKRWKLVLPTKGLTDKKNGSTLTNLIRKTIFDFFNKDIDGQRLIETLGWLLFEKYKPEAERAKSWELSQCPACKKTVEILEAGLDRRYVTRCPKCNEPIYLTDVFRLHEAIDDDLGAAGVLGYLSTTIEQLLIVQLIKRILDVKSDLLRQILIVKDGQLAFFGQTANIHKPMGELIRFLKAHHDINLVGLEKNGAFVDHASMIRDKIKDNQIVLLGSDYIYKYIVPGKIIDDKPYGTNTYYSHKLIFKSKYGNVYVASIPTCKLKLNPTLDDYINWKTILNNIAYLKCDLYCNSLIPVVLANKLVSLSDHPSADILKTFAKENIRIEL